MDTHSMEVIRMGYKLHSTEEEKEMVQEYINGVPVKTNYLLPEGVEFVIYDKRFTQKYLLTTLLHHHR